MSKIPEHKLTKEFLEAYAQEKIETYLSTDPGDEELAWVEVQKAYKVAGLEKPKKIIWYDSPKEFGHPDRDWETL